MKQTRVPFDLARFVVAQEDCYSNVVSELRRGEKVSHWMWFIFPQLAGLGSSEMARRFAIDSKEEARAYLAHPMLGARLRECTRLVMAVWRDGRRYSIEQIFGYPDDLKFKSSMTLFACATEEDPVFQEALDIYFGGAMDRWTQERL